jgi:hypothetical protein
MGIEHRVHSRPVRTQGKHPPHIAPPSSRSAKKGGRRGRGSAGSSIGDRGQIEVLYASRLSGLYVAERAGVGKPGYWPSRELAESPSAHHRAHP